MVEQNEMSWSELMAAMLPIIYFIWLLFENKNMARCTLCNKVCHWLLTDHGFFLLTPVSFTNETDCHNINEILLKVALSTIKGE